KSQADHSETRAGLFDFSIGFTWEPRFPVENLRDVAWLIAPVPEIPKQLVHQADQIKVAVIKGGDPFQGEVFTSQQCPEQIPGCCRLWHIQRLGYRYAVVRVVW